MHDDLSQVSIVFGIQAVLMIAKVFTCKHRLRQAQATEVACRRARVLTETLLQLLIFA